jgi:hypothetical protein
MISEEFRMCYTKDYRYTISQLPFEGSDGRFSTDGISYGGMIINENLSLGMFSMHLADN